MRMASELPSTSPCDATAGVPKENISRSRTDQAFNAGVQTFKRVAESLQQLVTARILTSDAGRRSVWSIWKRRNLDLLEYSHLERISVQEAGSSCAYTSFVSEPRAAVFWSPSPSARRKLIGRNMGQKGETSPSVHLEWFHENQLVSTIVVGQDVHGALIEGEELMMGCRWSPDENQVVYLAQEAPVKKSLWQQTVSNDGVGDAVSVSELPSTRFDHRSGFGEGYPNCRAVLVHVSLPKKVVRVICLEDTLPKSFWPVDAWFLDSDRIIVVGYGDADANRTSGSHKLGLRYCSNRPLQFAVISISATSQDRTTIPSSKALTFGSTLRLSPSRKLAVFLRNPIGGPHRNTSSLCVMTLDANGMTIKEMKLNDEIREQLKPASSFFLDNLVDRCFSADEKSVFFTAICGSARRLFRVDLHDMSLHSVIGGELGGEKTFSQELVDVCPSTGALLVVSSAINQPPSLQLLSPTHDCSSYSRANIFSNLSDRCFDELRGLVVQEISGDTFGHALLIQSAAHVEVSGKQPLMVIPHGGPHTVFSNQFDLYFAVFALCGFKILLVNYRGSLGFNASDVSGLPGHIGGQDVEDVSAAINHAVRQGLVDDSRVVLFGGSHGGFIVAHLIARFPKKYKAAIMRNPVIDLPSMFAITDLPDWCLVESGIDRLSMTDFGYPTEAEFSMMAKCSPSLSARSIECPVLLLLGEADKRVPMSQGLSLYRYLQSQQVTCRALVYPNAGHSLKELEAEADVFCNVLAWSLKHAT